MLSRTTKSKQQMMRHLRPLPSITDLRVGLLCCHWHILPCTCSPAAAALKSLGIIARTREQERDHSVATVVGDDDGEVEWIGTQPSKRARKGPSAGDEVVDVEE
jgi:hypothetical protein